MTWVDGAGNAGAHEMDAAIGAPPFGAGLTQWLSRSPEFNMHEVETPLQVVALGRQDVLTMCEPYAALRYLNKPVKRLILVNACDDKLPRSRLLGGLSEVRLNFRVTHQIGKGSFSLKEDPRAA